MNFICCHCSLKIASDSYEIKFLQIRKLFTIYEIINGQIDWGWGWVVKTTKLALNFALFPIVTHNIYICIFRSDDTPFFFLNKTCTGQIMCFLAPKNKSRIPLVKNCETHCRGVEVQINYNVLKIFNFRFHLYLFYNLSISLNIFWCLSIYLNSSQYLLISLNISQYISISINIYPISIQ